MEGGSLRLIRAEWSLQDYSGLSRHWARTAPPPYISMALIATAHGAKFGIGGPPRALSSATTAENPDPLSLAAYLGQSGDMPAYAAPRRGLIIDPGGNS